MSVRLRKWKDQEGAVQETWIVDVKYRYPDGIIKAVRQTSPVQTRRGAEQHERQLREALQNGTYGKEHKEALTLEQFQKRFLTHAKTNNKYSTVKSKTDIVRKHLLPAFGNRKLRQIGPYEIEAFKANKLDEGLSPKTINNVLTVLRKLLVLAVEWDELPTVPRIAWMKVPKPEFDFLSFEDADRLVTSAEPEWKTMLLVALHTGLRLGELVALQWDCVDLKGRRLFVKRNSYRGRMGTPKNGRSREIPLSDTALQVLKAHRHLKGSFVFCTAAGDMLNAYNRCQNAISRQCRRAGLRPVGWHALRHTFASHLVMRGVPLKVVQELMGHATIEMTMRYSHLSPHVTAEAVKVLDIPGGHTEDMEAGSAVSP